MVSCKHYTRASAREWRVSNQPAGEEEEDGMDEIDAGNIITGGRRTRGRVIDFAKAAEENPAQEEDEDDDDDFQAPDEDVDMKE